MKLRKNALDIPHSSVTPFTGVWIEMISGMGN